MNEFKDIITCPKCKHTFSESEVMLQEYVDGVMSISHPFFKHIINTFVEIYEKSGSENFFSIGMVNKKDGKKYDIIIQHK